jgi:hypothetical protein
MPRETKPTPWATLIIMAVIILYSTVLSLYLMVAGRVTTLLPVLVGNVTVSQGGVKVRVMAFGATYKITGITPQGKSGVVVACRLTEAYINNTQAPLTPPWILKNGQSLVFMLSDCANVSQVVVSYDNGRVMVIPVRG